MIRKPGQRKDPLERYAEESPSAIMREMASIAANRGYSQATLADALETRAPNLDRYFASKRPHLDTVDRFAKLLKLPKQYIRLLLEPSRTTGDDLDELRYKLGEEIRNSKAFDRRAIPEWARFFRNNPGLEVALLRDFGLALYRSAARVEEPFQIPMVAWPGSVTPQLRAFAERALPHFDLAQYLRRDPKRSDSLFVILYYFMVEESGVPRSKALEILEIVRAVFRNNNIAYLALDEYLREDLGFRTDEFMSRSAQLPRRNKARK